MGSDLLDQFLFYTFWSYAISWATSHQSDVPKLTGIQPPQLQDRDKEQKNNITAQLEPHHVPMLLGFAYLIGFADHYPALGRQLSGK